MSTKPSYQELFEELTSLEAQLTELGVPLPELKGSEQRIAGFPGVGWTSGAFFPDQHQPYLEKLRALFQASKDAVSDGPKSYEVKKNYVFDVHMGYESFSYSLQEGEIIEMRRYPNSDSIWAGWDVFLEGKKRGWMTTHDLRDLITSKVLERR